jgi:DinB family protein
MDPAWKETLWRQFGASIETLEGIMAACPDHLWFDRKQRPEFWYLVFHTLFWLDCYLTQPFETYTPPPPFGLEEMDPAGVIPARPYTKAELAAFLEHGRRRWRARLAAMNEADAQRPYVVSTGIRLDLVELLLYNMRHVQHHSAQLNLILRQQTDSAAGWVSRAKSALEAQA